MSAPRSARRHWPWIATVIGALLVIWMLTSGFADGFRQGFDEGIHSSPTTGGNR